METTTQTMETTKQTMKITTQIMLAILVLQEAENAQREKIGKHTEGNYYSRYK